MNSTDDTFRSRFEIRRELGRGGMGEVHLAWDTYHQREVAVKLVKLAAMDDPDVGPRLRRMWVNETRLAGKLKHPYIVETYEAGVTGEHGYLVLEYVEGASLRNHVAHSRLLAFDAVVEILYKVCSALDYANTLGLLHRDIKPANVMLRADGMVKVTDFGTVYFTNSDETQVFDVGTLPFMPPEHFKRRPPTIQSDIYAVGVMAYQLLTGTLPFAAGSYDTMIRQKLKEDFTPIDVRRKDIPPELRFVVHRAIHKDVEVRFSNWADFSDALAMAQPGLALPRETQFDSSRFKALKGIAFFSAFSDVELWETVHLSNWRHKEQDEIVFAEGETGRNIYVITSGGVVIEREGTELNRLGSGECFGEIAFLDEASQRRTASVRAAGSVVLLEIDADALRQSSVSLQAAFAHAFMRVMVQRIRHADRRFLEVMAGRA